MSEEVKTEEQPETPETQAEVESIPYLEITLIREEFPIRIKVGDKVTEYKLVEMTGLERDRYMARTSKRFKTGKAGDPTAVQDLDNIQAELIACCLYDQYGKPVHVDTISAWPTKAQNALHKKCMEMNGLGKDEKQGK